MTDNLRIRSKYTTFAVLFFLFYQIKFELKSFFKQIFFTSCQKAAGTGSIPVASQTKAGAFRQNAAGF